MTTIYCHTPTEQSEVLRILAPKVNPVNRPDMVIMHGDNYTSLTHISDCDGYQFTAKEYLKTDKK